MKELLPGDPERLGSYEIRSRIGTGGMGVVYLGRSPSGRLAAVKLIRPEIADDAEFRARFRREIDAARRVSGAFTAAVLDADADAPQPWLATAYVDGPSLRERVTDAGPLPELEARRLGAGLAEALTDLHRVGLVHRDIKPGNVLLAADGPRLIDFGIIRSDALADLTDTGYVLGSAGYMAPEQAAGEHTGPAADVFALGAVLTFALTGRGPFGTGSAATLLLRTVNEEPDISDVPAELRGVIQRCLAADPADRPQSHDLIAMLAPDAEPLAEWERPKPADPAPRTTGTLRPSPAAGRTAAASSAAPVANKTSAAPLASRTAVAPVGSKTTATPFASSWTDTKNPPPIPGPSRRVIIGGAMVVGVVGFGAVVTNRGGSSPATSPYPDSYPTSWANPYSGPAYSLPTTSASASSTPPRLVWHTTSVQGTALDDLGAALALSPVDPTVYAMTDAGFIGLDQHNGTGQWIAATAPFKPHTKGANQAPLVKDNTVYLVSDSTVVAVRDGDPKNVLWTVDVSPLHRPQLLGLAGSSLVLYQDSNDGPAHRGIRTVDTAKHVVQWSLDLGPRDAVAVTDGGLLVRADPVAAKITAHHPADGRVAWTSAYYDPPSDAATVVAGGGLVYTGGVKTTVLDAEKGLFNGFSVGGDFRMIAADNAAAYAIDREGDVPNHIASISYTGSIRWHQPFDMRERAADSTYLMTPKLWIIASPRTHDVTAIDAARGDVLWQWSEPSPGSGPDPTRYSLAFDSKTDLLFIGAPSGIYCLALSE